MLGLSYKVWCVFEIVGNHTELVSIWDTEEGAIARMEKLKTYPYNKGTQYFVSDHSVWQTAPYNKALANEQKVLRTLRSHQFTSI